MESSILKQAAEFLRNKKNARRWMILVLCLAAVVGLATVAALKQSGQAMTKKKKVLDCDYNVHVHTENCYEEINGEKQLVCGYADYVVHIHNDDCYDENGKLVCPLPEIEPHTHDESCYGNVRTLTCGQEETEGHIHTDDCYTTERTLTCGQEETPGHTHDDSCYDEEGNLICGQEETPGHTHDDSCYTEERILTCGQEETPGHTHDDSCYTEERGLVCGKLELHNHDDSCYEVQKGVDADNDGEDDKILVCKIPVLEEHVHDEDCFKIVELSQEEVEALNNFHKDSQEEEAAPEEENKEEPATDVEPEYICGKEEHTHDASCYDEEGNLICEKEEHTHDATCIATKKDEGEANTQPTQEFEFICGKEGHTHDDTCYDEEGNLICEKEEHTHTKDCMNLTFTCGKEEHIHGAECRDETGSELICGKEAHTHDLECLGIPEEELTFYCGKEEHKHTQECHDANGHLICELEEHTHDFPCLVDLKAEQGTSGEKKEDVVLKAEGENYVITVTIPKESLPEVQGELRLQVRELEADGEEFNASNEVLVKQGVEVENQRIFDIKLMDGETEVEPAGPVTVSYRSTNADVEKKENVVPKVYHIDTDKKEANDMEATEAEDGSVVITTPHFSKYSFVILDNYAFATIANTDIFNWMDLKGATKGEATLQADIDATSAIQLTGNLTVNLNGHKITNKINSGLNSNALYITGAYTLTINDSSVGYTKVKEIVEGPGEEAAVEAGTLAKYFPDDETLTYYVTKPATHDDDHPDIEIGTTKDTNYEYTIGLKDVGAIEGKPAVWVSSGGKVELQGGRLTNPGGAAIVSVDGNVTISGGFICGCVNRPNKGNANKERKDNGGGIYVLGSKGTVNMTGGVIAANEAWNGGGIYLDDAKFMTMSGGVISGNYAVGYGEGVGASGGIGNITAYGGGGVYSKGTNFTLSGGYITNNKTDGNYHGTTASLAEMEKGNTTQGGGGVFFTGVGKTLTMSGGSVTANYAWNAAGGIYMRGPGGNSTFEMTGGFISSNYVKFREGGGLYIGELVSATINPNSAVYITNNQTDVTRDWGGGGVFVSGHGSLFIYNTLITKNHANGFGGGLGGCPTGRLHVQADAGAAIYGNSASGTQLTVSGKTQDHEAHDSRAFMEGGYQDFFSALTAQLFNTMLGNGAANWYGTIDYQPVTDSDRSKEYLESTSMAGLTAHPDTTAINAALEQAMTFISGNISNTHGGGIMCNGLLSFGTKEIHKFRLPVDIYLSKRLEDTSGNSVGMVNGQFKFSLYDSNKNLISTGTNNEDGKITGLVLDCPIKGENTKEFFYLVEDNNGIEGITYSNRVYRIELLVHIKDHKDNTAGADMYYYDTCSVYQSDMGWPAAVNSTDWTQLINNSNEYVGNKPSPMSGNRFFYGGFMAHGELYLHYNESSQAAFVNKVTEQPIYLQLVKQSKNSKGDLAFMQGVSFRLEKIENDSPVSTVTQMSSADGRFSFTLKKNSTYHLSEVVNEANKNYWTAGPWIVETNESGEIHVFESNEKNWEKGEEVDTTKIKFNSSGDGLGNDTTYEIDCYQVINEERLHGDFIIEKIGESTAKLSGAVFKLTDLMDSSKTYPDVTTDENGHAKFEQLEYGHNYLLEEITPPEGYKLPDYKWYVTIDREGNYVFYRIAKNQAVETYVPRDDDKDATVKMTDEGGLGVFQIVNTPTEDLYELPETGGPGVITYTMSGLMLIAAFAALMYNKKIRERRARSSRI